MSQILQDILSDPCVILLQPKAEKTNPDFQHNTQHNNIQHYDIEHNGTQNNAIQHNHK